jgi:hypothetical protein
MSTNRINNHRRVSRTSFRVIFGLALSVCLGGCHEIAGIFAAMGSKDRKVEARYQLGPGPVLILVDDVNQLIDWPAAPHYLADELSQRLIRHKAATKVVPPETLENLRQSVEGFSKKSAREIGELAGADQVLWIETQSFLATDEVSEASEAALWTVTVKVLNAREKSNRAGVRQWPIGPSGEAVNVRMTAATAVRLKTRDAVSRGLANLLAIEITKIFATHRESDFQN